MAPKGREWLMKWLPSRAHDNGIYAVFSNPVGMDDDQLKNGCSMIIDPFGEIIAECRELGDCFVTATVTPEKLRNLADTGIQWPEGPIFTGILSAKTIHRSRKWHGLKER